MIKFIIFSDFIRRYCQDSLALAGKESYVDGHFELV